MRSLSVTRKKPLTICIVSSVHRAFDTRIFEKEARTLALAGHTVILIASHERDEVVQGVQIKALPKWRGRLRRFFGLGRPLRLALATRADVYHLHDAELLPLGIIIKAVTGAKIVYDIHEDLPSQILSKYWIPRRLRKTVARIAWIAEAVGVRFFDKLVAATPAIALRFPADKTVVVQNMPIIGGLLSIQERPYAGRPNRIAYVGDISVIRGVKEMVQAVAMVPGSLEARLAVAGTFTPAELEADVRETPGAERVEFLGWQTREEVAGLLGQSRIGLVVLHPDLNHIESQPNKLFEYMSVGIPVIASDFPLWHEFVESSGCGLLVDPLDPPAIAAAITYLLENPQEAEIMGKRGEQAIRDRYNWENEAQKLLPIYTELVG